jgi:hypothetical protein
MKLRVMGTKKRKNGFGKYETTLILLSILLAVMGIIMFMPFTHAKPGENSKVVNYSK